MSDNFEPTETISRPNDQDTFSRTIVEQHVKALNAIMQKALTEGDAAVDTGAVCSEPVFSESFELLRRIVKRNDELRNERRRHGGGGGGSTGASAPAEAALENELLAFSLSCVSDAVFAFDREGIIVVCNRAAETLCGKAQQELTGEDIDEIVSLVNERTLDTYGNVRDTFFREDGPKELRCIFAIDGVPERNVLVRGEILPGHDGNGDMMILLIRDCSQQEQLEEELLRVRKLESVGLLAGGIAHDFNNILTGIITNLFMARMSVYQNGEACQLIAEAEKAAFKATRLTKQLLTFSQSGAPVKESVIVCQLIEETVGFSLSGSNVDYKLQFAENIRPVEVDKGQIDQVLNNLIINAAQAMSEGGTVTIAAENRTFVGGFSLEDRQFSSPALPLPDGDYVKVSVSDEGPGVPKKHIGKIFDPYFSTKSGSTGLGLTSAYSIIKKHGGHIEVESQPGQGARFSFYLPAATTEKPEDGQADLVRAEASGNILVMDDDVTIRTVIEKLLKKTGYTVVSVTNGTEALKTYIEAFNRREPFQFVIMDLTIPGGMGGKETVAKLKEFDKEAKVAVFSGYSNDPILTNFKEYGFDGVLKKPFSTDELFRLIKTFKTMTGAE